MQWFRRSSEDRNDLVPPLRIGLSDFQKIAATITAADVLLDPFQLRWRKFLLRQLSEHFGRQARLRILRGHDSPSCKSQSCETSRIFSFSLAVTQYRAT